MKAMLLDKDGEIANTVAEFDEVEGMLRVAGMAFEKIVRNWEGEIPEEAQEALFVLSEVVRQLGMMLLVHAKVVRPALCHALRVGFPAEVASGKVEMSVPDADVHTMTITGHKVGDKTRITIDLSHGIFMSKVAEAG